MKKIDLGQAVNTLANLGVIAGIVFLALELQQNNDLLASEIRSTRHIVRRDDYLLPLQYPQLGEALIKHRNGQPLSEYEGIILNRAMTTNLFNLQYVFTEYRQGRIAESAIPIESWRGSFNGDTLTKPGYWPDARDFWEANRFEFDPAFVEWMDENIVNPR